MNAIIFFLGGMALGGLISWAHYRQTRRDIKILQTQYRILAATVADNFMDVEELRSEVKEIHKELDGMKDWVTGELMSLGA